MKSMETAVHEREAGVVSLSTSEQAVILSVLERNKRLVEQEQDRLK